VRSEMRSCWSSLRDARREVEADRRHGVLWALDCGGLPGSPLSESD
jgi:hypothetical protein